jgi:peptide deformylase
MIQKIVLLSEDLHKVADVQTEFNDELKQVIIDLFDTLGQTTGCGLAAPQIGDYHRVFVVKYKNNFGEFKEAFINPEIIESEGEQSNTEGCLSVPGIFEKVPRYDRIKVRYTDHNGNQGESEFTGMISNIIQHELDHLNGITFVDKLPKVRLKKLRRKLEYIRCKRVYTTYSTK